MKTLIADGTDEFAEIAAALIASKVTDKPHLALTLPTGSTPLALYERLAREYRAGRFSLAEANVFMLDEYVDLPSYPEDSFREYLERHLGEVAFGELTTVHSLGPPGDLAQCASYDAQLDAVGGLDLAIVGVGRNGHVGFNEPGTSPGARTHVVTLAEGTIEANFANVDVARRPSRAVTVGLRDLREARAIVMLVAGAFKHDVARTLVAEHFDSVVPATWLLGHPQLTVVVAGELLEPS